MTSTDDDATLPAPPRPSPAEAPRPTFSRWSAALLAALVLFVGGYLVLSTVHVGYFVQSPGSAVALQGRVDVSGIPSYPSDGDVHFTTVRLSRERASLLDVFGDWLDPASVLVSDERILQGRSVDENRAFNQELMQSSQELAENVALEYMGLDVIRSNGALVSEVQEGTPADGVLEPGDVVVAADGEPVTSSEGLVAAIGERSAGDEIVLDVRPLAAADDAEPHTVPVVLAEHPDGGDRGFLGVAIGDSVMAVEVPFEIDVDTRTVGGPSAGLALTLSIIDLLTEGELTGGLQVATTGTIGVDGAVGPVGGIEQKAHAVRRAGIDVFIVPRSDAETAQAVLGDSVAVVGVDTLDEAVEALGRLGGDVESLALPADLQPAA